VARGHASGNHRGRVQGFEKFSHKKGLKCLLDQFRRAANRAFHVNSLKDTISTSSMTVSFRYTSPVRLPQLGFGFLGHGRSFVIARQTLQDSHSR
jgi:hypothetical protein